MYDILCRRNNTGVQADGDDFMSKFGVTSEVVVTSNDVHRILKKIIKLGVQHYQPRKLSLHNAARSIKKIRTHH